MLYLRWLETSRKSAARPAVVDGARTVSFGELAERAAAAPAADRPVVARTGGVDFFVDLLRAWRDGQAAIPVEREAPEPELRRPPPVGIALVKHTPGARGIPRGIFFRPEALVADADRLVAAMGLTTDTPNLAAISLAHSYGFSSIVLPLFLHGVPVHLAPVPFPRPVEAILDEHGPVVVPAVPSIWRAWHRAGILRKDRIALAVSAGAPLSLDLERAVFESSGLKIHNFYGASECGGISFDDSETPRESADDVGRPLPGVEISFAVDGRLAVTSDAVAEGYDEPREDDRLGDGQYLTRDLGWLDEGGRIRLSGTLAGAINVSGRKVSPAKVEAALTGTGLVMRAKVFGTPSPDPERCEEISAVVELRDGATLEKVRLAAAGRLESWEMPRHWHSGGDFPVSGTGGI